MTPARPPVRRLARRLGERRAAGPDAGMTLVEVVIAMLLTVIAVAIMIPSLVPFMQVISSSRVHSTSTSDAQIVFERIDSEVRFAEAINQQGYGVSAFADGQKARYVEWLTPAESSPTGRALCTQWRYVPATRTIEERQWNLGSTPPVAFTQRLELALDQPGAADAWGRPTYPFAMASASQAGAQPLQSLTLWVYAGESESDATTQIRTRFVARNSAITAVTNDNASTGWGQVSAAGYGDPAGYADPTAGRKVPLVCDGTVKDDGTFVAFTGSVVFRP